MRVTTEAGYLTNLKDDGSVLNIEHNEHVQAYLFRRNKSHRKKEISYSPSKVNGGGPMKEAPMNKADWDEFDSELDKYLDDLEYGHVRDKVLSSIEDRNLADEISTTWDRKNYRTMPASDPAQFLLRDEHVSTPKVFDPGCYICNDPEFAMMGMPLCFACESCGGHVPADDVECGVCGVDQQALWEKGDVSHDGTGLTRR